MEFCTTCENLHLFTRLSHFVIPISWNFFILHLAMCFLIHKALGQTDEGIHERNQDLVSTLVGLIP